MFIFYTTLLVSWFLVRIIWSGRAAKYSLIAIIPIAIICTPAMLEDESSGMFNIGFAFAFVYAFAFVVVMVIIGSIKLLRSVDWNDSEQKQQFLEGFINGLLNDKNGNTSSSDDYGSYVIQYRSGSTWVDGPGSNDERIAESMFDRFLENDPRSSRRCRLVYKVNGRVKQVLGTN